jgi:hypothetical protein
MQKYIYLFILLLWYVHTLTGQIDHYPVSTYKARYDLRPAMSTNSSFDYAGIITDGPARNAVNLDLPLSWSLRRNTDARILEWNWGSNVTASFGDKGGDVISGPESFNTYNLNVFANRAVYHYKDNERFWGWGMSLFTTPYYSTQNEWTGRYQISCSPSVYRGVGRIEFAEDALLAKWMMEDLQAVGVVEEYGIDHIHALARTITDIIGDRTFDFRRRYIYRMKALTNTLLESGLVKDESIELFSVLSDNWLFANRTTLPHGKRLTYGISGTGFHSLRDGKQEVPNQLFRAEGGLFAAYTSARIINENGGDQWSAGLEGRYLHRSNKYDDNPWLITADTWLASVYLSYQRRWLLSSRTSLGLNNRISGIHFFNDPVFVNISQDPWTTINAQSNFIMEYFIAYHWTLEARVGVNASYRHQDIFAVQPRLYLTTRYFVF